MPPGQPAHSSKIPSDYYCRTQAVYKMDVALPRFRLGEAFFCSGERERESGGASDRERIKIPEFVVWSV